MIRAALPAGARAELELGCSSSRPCSRRNPASAASGSGSPFQSNLGQHVEGLSERSSASAARPWPHGRAEHHPTFDRDIMSCIPTVSTADRPSARPPPRDPARGRSPPACCASTIFPRSWTERRIRRPPPAQLPGRGALPARRTPSSCRARAASGDALVSSNRSCAAWKAPQPCEASSAKQIDPRTRAPPTRGPRDCRSSLRARCRRRGAPPLARRRAAHARPRPDRSVRGSPGRLGRRLGRARASHPCTARRS